MILDNFLTFSGTSNGAVGAPASGPQTDSPTTGTQIASNIIDLGVASGIPSSANGGGGRDIGIGDKPSLELSAVVTTAFVGGTSLQLEVSGAPDNGAGLPGTYTVMWTGPAVVLASLTQGAALANVDVPRTIAGQVPPRFLRLRYISAGTFTAGAIEAQIVIDRDDQITGVGGVYSGYPAGINIAN